MRGVTGTIDASGSITTVQWVLKSRLKKAFCLCVTCCICIQFPAVSFDSKSHHPSFHIHVTKQTSTCTWFYYYHRLPDLVKLAISPVMKLFDQTLLQMDMTNILRYISQGIDHCCWCCYSSGVMIHSVVVWMLSQVEPCVKTARDQSVRYVIFKI